VLSTVFSQIALAFFPENLHNSPGILYSIEVMAFRHYLIALFVLAVAISCPTADAQPSDSFVLECTFRSGEGILAPQQTAVLDVTLRPTSPDVNAAASYTLSAQLRTDDHNSISNFTAQITPNVPLPISFVTPEKDGTYFIGLTVNLGPPPRSILPVTYVTPFVQVQRQFVVLGAQTAPRSTGDWTLTDRRIVPLSAESRLNEEPSRRLLPNLSNFPQLPNVPQLPLPSLPRVAPLPRIADLPRPAELIGRIPSRLDWRHSSDSSQSLPQDVPRFTKNAPLSLSVSQNHFLEQSERNPNFSSLPAAENNGCTLHSLPINVEIGKPYLIEIDYPVDAPQTLGVAIVNGLAIIHGLPPPGVRVNWCHVGEVSAAATIHVAEEVVQDTRTETVATHRLLFWAATERPNLILVNWQPDREALFRNIRISRVVTPGMQEDQRLPKLFEETAQRKRIGQILEPHSASFWVNMGRIGVKKGMIAPAVDVQDWQTAFEQSSRLIDTLHRGGYDGITLTVPADIATSHPNEPFNPLELAFRRFTSEGLTLIPAIEFDMPLPSLERSIQQYPLSAKEICIGNPELHHYNLLNPDVQRALAEVILELVDRFGHHPSFGGVAIVLSPETYAQLPFARIPPDASTFSQFRQDTERELHLLGIQFPNGVPNMSGVSIQWTEAQNEMQRLQFLEGNPKVWETWVRWRAAKVSRFYADLARQMTDRRGDAPLYLLGGTMFDQSGIEQFCVPTLPKNFAPLQAIQLLGFDLPLLSRTESLHFLKPVIISTERHHSYDGLDSADTVPYFSQPSTAGAGMLTGVQFVHDGDDYFVTTPAHIQSRKRFVRQLAQADVLMFMDAGVTLPFGQEHAQFDLLNTYRQLPPVPFQTFQTGGLSTGGLAPPAHGNSLQPLTIRTHNLPDGMMMYIVNDAPFAVEADFFFTADSRSTISELTGHRMIRSLSRHYLAGTPSNLTGAPSTPGPPRLTWRASLQPYDLLAIQISDANAKIDSVTVHRSPAIEEALKRKVEELVQRVHAARGGVLFDGLVNGDFEMEVSYYVGRAPGVEKRDIIPGWQEQDYRDSLTVKVDRTVASKGESSAKLTNNSTEPGTFLSDPVDTPATGRLDVSMFIGIPADAQSQPMSVVLSAKHRGQPFFRSAPIEATLMPLFANVEPRNGVRWHPVVVPFRLPLDSLEEVRIGVQYSGIGTVWIDDVTLRHISFSQNEIVELHRKLAVADLRSSEGRVSELISLLEGHWAQYLFEHIPAPTQPPVIFVASRPAATEAPPPPSPTLYQRMRGLFVR